jgi:hypothetical protein
MRQTSIFRMTGAATRLEREGWPTAEYSDRSSECMDCSITEPNVTKQTEKLTLQQLKREVQVAPLQHYPAGQGKG